MARGSFTEVGRGWAVGVAVAFVAALALFVAGLVVSSNRAAPVSQGELDRIAAAASAADASDVAAAPLQVAVYGDSYTGGSGMGGNGDANWTALIGQRIPGIQLTVNAAGGAGYTATSPATGENFLTLVQDHPVTTANLIVIFGSRNDGTGDAEAVTEAATAVYSTVLAAAPGAKLVVIGPPWVNSDVPDGISTSRDAVRDAAAAAGATFVDPLTDGWFFDRPDLIGSDGVHPTDDGHIYMADRIEPVLRQALGL